MSFAFSPYPDQLPRPADLEKVERGLERLREAAAQPEDPAVSAVVAEIAENPDMLRLLEGVFGNSGFLGQCLVRDIAFVPVIFNRGFDQAFENVMQDLATLNPAASFADTGVGLRRAKRRVALLTALADLAGIWPLASVTERLSQFCGAALSAAIRHLLTAEHSRGRLQLPNPDSPETDCGYIVLGMGKLGAFELNYSSDIDLIVLYDHDVVPAADEDRMQQNLVRMTRDLVKLMDERTGEGYVFRTDLRLRPDPGATPVALSTFAAETYYESLGQNWERAAMIKARPVAGDIAAGKRFLESLQPFVWRRHLDFAAIEDIQSIKRQIHAHKGGSTVAIAGHNVKLGRGGIREVEFFTQTQQLIWGGRDPELRSPFTISAIEALVDAGRVEPDVAADMIESYRYLRRLEHRLQMVDDQQTHSLPDTDEGLESVAAFMGYDDRAGFEADLMNTLRTVESHYADLFEESEPLGGGGTLVFTGADDHPDTLTTLREMGFSDPESISTAIRAWHHGRHRATRSNRSREILTELMPAILAALSSAANPDIAFRRFNELIAGLPAGVQLFSLFQANPSLLDLVAEITGGAPRMAEWLGRNPLLLDGVLATDFFDSLPDASAMATDLSELMTQAIDMQDVHDIARRWVNDAKFQVGVQILRNKIDIDRADRAFSDIADTAIQGLLPPILDEFIQKHGRCPGSGFAVLALGKLGGRELSATSDLDLVFLYDSPALDQDETVMSDGKKPLSISHYYQRLSQRVVNAMTALTGEGRLYEVDMRLRPSGNAGPLSVSLDSFATYQRESAWTWEHLALTRARVVCADSEFRKRIDAELRNALATERPADDLLVAVAEMRERMAKEQGTDNPWSVKHVRGGLVDCEFIAQYLLLLHAHDNPEILDTGTSAAFANLRDAGYLDTSIAEDLIEATCLWRRLQGLLRLTLEGGHDPEIFPGPLQQKLADAGSVESYDTLDALVRETAERTYVHFNKIIAEPASAVKASRDSQTNGETEQ
ncbi:MAG: bifunctional [glutamine synthetase] adenylyltransferase/[glutamine synthetase]-adenylyl-L-tyrosine phosphorylase [Alphaproteobacteria bacterium]